MKIKCFGIAKDIVDNDHLLITKDDTPKTVAELRQYLSQHYPSFKHYKSCMIAVNQAYANDDMPIKLEDEIAIIPPVSGG